MQKILRPVARPPLLHHSVQEAIRTYILENELQADDPLPAEGELARQLGVSRNSVREAVKALESLGVLETRRGTGIFVRDFSFEPLLDSLQYGLLFELRELAELLEIRRVLETGMIGRALETMTEERLAALAETVEQMRRRAEAGEAFPEEDRAFHQLLFEDLGNKTLLKLLDVFWLAFHKAVEHSAAAIWDTDPMWTCQAHATIVTAMQSGHVEDVRTALDEHYTGLSGRLARATQRQA